MSRNHISNGGGTSPNTPQILLRGWSSSLSLSWSLRESIVRLFLRAWASMHDQCAWLNASVLRADVQPRSEVAKVSV